MATWSKRRIVLVVALVLVAAIVVPPYITLSHYSGRIATAIGNAVGRKVTVGKVTLRLFPEPGLTLENLVVSDDPSLNAEPMLTSGEVSATLRLSSLWRARLEVGKLSLKYPSMNLVRGPDGRWNVEALLEQARRIPSAPTAKGRPESRLRFPYIEAEGGRINFKFGVEKKVYALSEADFALWLASENQWGIRLAARPVRTDGNLSDTGTLKLSGTFERAPNLRLTPLHLRLEIEDAQLGQLTTLIYGRDRGWRGALNGSVTLRGTPAALDISTDATVEDFRRYDILSGEPLRLRVQCAAAFSTATETLSPLNCQLPLEGGVVSVSGDVQDPVARTAYAVNISAERLPAQALVVLLRHVKKDLPPDLAAGGLLEATFTLQRGPGEQAWSGSGALSDVELASRALGPPLRLGEISFVLDGPGTHQLLPMEKKTRSVSVSSFPQKVISLRPFTVPLSGAAPASAQAWFSSSGYNLEVQGDGRVQRLLQVARGLGLRAPQIAANGTARFDLRFAGSWFGFAAPTATGSAQLRSITATLRGVAAPLQISSAELTLTPENATLQKIAASFPGKHVALNGWVRLPRGCATLNECPAHFELTADQLSTDDLNELLNPRLRRRPWYDVLPPRDSGSLFANVRAEGHLSVNRLLVESVAARRVVAAVRFEPGKLAVTDLRGQLFGGTLRAEWQADFAGSHPAYALRGTLESASMAQIAAAMDDEWATGSANLSYQGTASGWTGAGLAASATGSLQFDWRDGALAHVALAGAKPPLHIRRFAGRMELRAGVLEIAASRMETSAGIYKVSGTASLARQLGITLLGDGAPGFVITGPLAKPQVAAAPASQASLKQ